MDELLARIYFAAHLTDEIHLCQLHTAAWGWLLARTMQGEFFIDESKAVVSALAWLGLDWDEPVDFSGKPVPYLAERAKYLQLVLQQLLQTEQAYCDEHGDVYLALPQQGQTVITESLRGELVFQNKTLGLVKVAEANGRFLPSFATLIDAYHLQVTHAVYPYAELEQLPAYHHFYQSLGWVEPVWLFLPQLIDKDRRPIQPTDVAYRLESLQDVGYLPQALLNYLWLLGGSFTEKMLGKWRVQQEFQRDILSSRPAMFEWVDLNWLNKQYIQRLSHKELAQHLSPFLESNYPIPESRHWLESLTANLRHNLTTLSDVVPAALWAFEPAKELTAEGLDALERPQSKVVLMTLIAEIAQLVVLDLPTAEQLIAHLRGYFLERGWNGRYVLSPIRSALIGHVSGPAIPQLLAILGKEETLQRLATALKKHTFATK